MKLHLDSADASKRITAYDRHSVTVAGTRFDQTFLITPEDVYTGISVPDPAELRWAHLDVLQGRDVGILIIGTGRTQRLPDPELYAELARRAIGLEVMDSPAACRTYNILLGEGRRVAALIVVP